MTIETFTKCTSVLQGLFGQIDDNKLKLYYSVLSHISDSDFETATKRLINTFKPTATVSFPVPSDFLAGAGMGATEQAQKLMGLVTYAVKTIGSYKSVDFGSPALHSVIMRYGGWPAICAWGQTTWDVNEGRFLKAIEYAIEYGENGGDHVAGIAEKTNDSIQYSGLTKIGRDNLGRVKIQKVNTILIPDDRPRAIKFDIDKFDMNKQLTKG